jgi:hypothetical protein
MKVWLDDERPAPHGWVLVRWPEDAIRLLTTGDVVELSLDHDLGDDTHGTGYDVILWIEERVATSDWLPPGIAIHTANLAARQRMLAGVASITRIMARRHRGVSR